MLFTYVEDEQGVKIFFINPRHNTFFEVFVEFPEYSEVMHDFPILYLALKEAY